MTKTCIVFDQDGSFDSILTEEEALVYIKDNPHLYAREMSKDIHSFVVSLDMSNIKVNMDKIGSEDTVFDSEDFFILEILIDIEKEKQELIDTFKDTCKQYIIHGLDIELSTGAVKLFSFQIEDQINLTALVENYTEGDNISYHADGEFDTLYSYMDIVTIYKALYNNKLYNQIYTQVMCCWIKNNLTVEMLSEKQDILSYGYCNDAILERIGELYDSQKLL